jgi:hypothetical protein
MNQTAGEVIVYIGTIVVELILWFAMLEIFACVESSCSLSDSVKIALYIFFAVACILFLVVLKFGVNKSK